MSNLIREAPAGKTSQSAPALLPLSPSVIIKHLKACQGMAQEHLERGFDVYLKSLFDAYEIEIDRAVSNKDATEMMGIQRAVRKKASDLKHYFCGYYLEGFVKFSKKKLNTSINPDDGARDVDEFSIIENDELEESIAISSITQRVDTYYAEPLWALNQRFSILNNGEPVVESGNPVAPIQFCDALKRSLKLIELSPRASVIAYKVFDLQLLNLFKLISEDVNDYLGNQGILPNLKYSLPVGSAPRSYLAEEGDTFGRRAGDFGIDRSTPDPESSPEQYQADLVAAIKGLQQQIRAGGVVAQGPIFSSDQVVGALAGMQASNDVHNLVAQAQPDSLVPVNFDNLINDLKARLAAENEEGAVKKRRYADDRFSRSGL